MKIVNFLDVCDIQGGTQPPKNEWSFDMKPGYVRMLQIRDFTQNKESHIEFVRDKPTLKKCSSDDILIGRYGASIGKILKGLSGAYNVALVKTVPNKDLLDKAYLFHFLNSNNFQSFIKNAGSRAAQAGFNKDELKDLQIPLPDLVTQKAIAAKLDKADEIRQLNKKLIEQYDALTQSLFLDMFGDPVKNEKGWEVKTIEHLVSKNKNSIKRGPFGGALKKEIFVSEGYLVYEQYHALNNDFTMERYFITEKKFKELEGFSVKAGDIIISCSGVYLGKLAVIPDDAKEGIINQALLKLTMNQEIMRNDFFVFHFSHENFKLKYFDSNRGAGIPNFPPMTDFKKFPFICPPLTLQNEFAERVKAIEVQKALAQQALQQSEDLFNSLLQESFQ